MSSTAQTAITDAASIATAVGVLALAVQTIVVRAQLRSSFEATFTERYVEIQKRIPLDAFFIESKRNWLSEFREPETLRPFFDYFELCEEEFYYRSVGRRISNRTWADWSVGMILNLDRPAFQDAWDVLDASIASRVAEGRPAGRFALLRRALDDIRAGVQPDPAKW